MLGGEPADSGVDGDAFRLSRRAQIDKDYDNGAAFPDVPEWRQTWLRRSAAVAIDGTVKLDVPYGAGPRQKLDIFPCADTNAPAALFVHGGFWSRNSKETFRFLAAGVHAAGLHAVFVGHTLAPDVGMDRMVGEIRAATHWIFTHLKDFGFAQRPLVVLGWSSGAQLAAMTMEATHVAAGMGISGIYDLESIQHGSINDLLKLDREEARRNSPTFSLPARAGCFDVAYGARELPAFCDQSERFHAAWTAAALPGRIMSLPGHHHHSVLDELNKPDGKLTLALSGLAADIP